MPKQQSRRPPPPPSKGAPAAARHCGSRTGDARITASRGVFSGSFIAGLDAKPEACLTRGAHGAAIGAARPERRGHGDHVWHVLVFAAEGATPAVRGYLPQEVRAARTLQGEPPAPPPPPHVTGFWHFGSDFSFQTSLRLHNRSHALPNRKAPQNTRQHRRQLINRMPGSRHRHFCGALPLTSWRLPSTVLP